MKTRVRMAFYTGIALILSACAIADVPVTPAPMATLSPAPTLTVSGGCDTTDDLYTLDNWLQTTGHARDRFVVLLDDAGQRGADVYALLQQMTAERDIISAVPVPQCALEAHVKMTDAIDRAIETFLAYNNRDIHSLGDIVSETKRRFDDADVLRLEITDWMEEQFQAM